jgi:hypothetical protein
VTGIAGCCPRAASGHAIAPPSAVMNSCRRFKHKVRRRKGGTYPLSHLYGHFGLVLMPSIGFLRGRLDRPESRRSGGACCRPLL